MFRLQKRATIAAIIVSNAKTERNQINLREKQYDCTGPGEAMGGRGIDFDGFAYSGTGS
jgi:hypothetical protein